MNIWKYLYNAELSGAELTIKEIATKAMDSGYNMLLFNSHVYSTREVLLDSENTVPLFPIEGEGKVTWLG